MQYHQIDMDYMYDVWMNRRVDENGNPTLSDDYNIPTMQEVLYRMEIIEKNENKEPEDYRYLMSYITFPINLFPSFSYAWKSIYYDYNIPN